MTATRKSGTLFTFFMSTLLLHTGQAARAANPVFTAAGGKAQALRVALVDYYPLNSLQDNQPAGLIYEYAQDILRSVNVPLEYSVLTMSRAVEQLKTLQADLALAMLKSEERAKFIRYSRKPLMWVTSGFCTLTPVQHTRLDARSRLAYVQGTLVPRSLQHMEQTPVSGLNAQVRMLQMLRKGRVDAIQCPMPGVMILAAHRAGMNLNLICYELKDSRQPVYLGFSKSVTADTRNKLEEALQKKVEAEDFDSFLKRRFQESGIKYPRLEVIDPRQLHRS